MMTSASFRLAIRSRVWPFTSRGCALVGTVGQLPVSAGVCTSGLILRHLGTWTPYRYTVFWKRVCELAICRQKGKNPSGRMMFGAVAFLWERERIRNDDAISCLKEYDDRVKSHLHIQLVPSADSPLLFSCTSDPELSGQTPSTHFQHNLQTLLQRNSEKHLSQLPLVGMQKMGPLSRISMRAESALSTVTHVATSRISKTKAHIYATLNSKSVGQANDGGDLDKNSNYEEMAEVQLHVQEDATTLGGDKTGVVDDERATKAANNESMLTYYVDHSKKHTNDLPLVGLRSPGPVYSLTIKIADLCQRRLGGESNLRRQASFLAHLGLSLCDVPSIQPFPLTLAGLQVNSTTLITEGFTALSLGEAFDSTVQQARALLSTCTSPRAMLAVFDSMSHQEGGVVSSSDSSSDSSVEEEKWEKEYCQEKVVTHGPTLTACNGGCEGQPSHQFSGNAASQGITCTNTDSYLAESGWERFAEAKNCTVYRKQHQSGLYMYKVIGTYTDISVKDFLDVQVEHSCRKSWDTYVQQLETVDVDKETGSEIVHWVMGFPFPMSSREYLYVRRMWLNQSLGVLINRSVDHPAVPTCRKYVRVQDYVSHTVLQPHTTTDQDGFEFELTYFDNPQTNLPSSCVNWVATAAMPEFLGKVHTAAVKRKMASPPNNSRLSTI